MKKNIFFTTLFLYLTAFFFFVPVFNLFVNTRIISYASFYDRNHYDRTSIIIENTSSVSSINYKEFHQKLNDLAIENNLVIYKLHIEDNNTDFMLYLSENDLFLKEALLLVQGQADAINENIIYSPLSPQKNQRILSIFSENICEVTSLINDIDNGSYYNLISLNENSEENFSRFFDALSAEFPNISYVRQTNQFIASDLSDFGMIPSQTENKLEKLSVVLILSLILGFKIFSKQKEISIRKIEGSASLAIYFEIFLRPLLIDFFIFYLISVLLCFVSFGFLSSTSKWVLFLYTNQLLQLALIELIVSLVYLLIIRAIPLVSSEKGKDSLAEVQLIALITKTAAVFIMVPLIFPSLNQFRDYIRMNLRHTHVLKLLENYYMFGNQGYSNYTLSIGSDNFISLRDDLVWNNGLFTQVKAFWVMNPASFSSSQNEYYAVDEAYLRQIGLLQNIDFNQDEIYVFIQKDMDFDPDGLSDKIRSLTRDPVAVNTLFYEGTLMSYSINDLLYQDAIYPLPLIYVPEEDGYKGQINSAIFYYSGSLSEAQDYIDSMFLGHAYTPIFRIVSAQSVYESLLNSYNSYHIQSLIQFIAVLVVYLLACRFLLEVDLDRNKKRYFLSLTEGVNPYGLGVYSVKFLLPSFAAFLLCFLSGLISVSHLTAVFVFISSAEAIFCLIFKIRCHRQRRIF